jgi:hypothetical protein
VSLTAIGEAFAVVAVLFIGAGATLGGYTGGDWGSGISGSSPPPRPESWGARLRAVWPGATFEACVVTLVAALWFGSLGHGGWVILFLLLGALPAAERWFRRRRAGAPAGRETTAFVAALLKYLLAGALCAWRLT